MIINQIDKFILVLYNTQVYSSSLKTRMDEMLNKKVIFKSLLLIALTFSFIILSICSKGSDNSTNPNKKEYSVHGRVVDTEENGVEDVDIIVEGKDINKTGKTDKNGIFSINGLVNGIYVLTPIKEEYNFNLLNIEFTIINSDKTIENIVAYTTHSEYDIAKKPNNVEATYDNETDTVNITWEMDDTTSVVDYFVSVSDSSDFDLGIVMEILTHSLDTNYSFDIRSYIPADIDSTILYFTVSAVYKTVALNYFIGPRADNPDSAMVLRK